MSVELAIAPLRRHRRLAGCTDPLGQPQLDALDHLARLARRVVTTAGRLTGR